MEKETFDIQRPKTFYFEYLGGSDFAWWVEPQEEKPWKKFAPVTAFTILRRMGTFLKRDPEGKVKVTKVVVE